MEKYRLDYLRQLEAESIYIIREAVSEFKNAVMLFSIGKDSCVMLHLARKAFYPASLPFPLLHIDTGFKFREMIEFRDGIAGKKGIELIVTRNEDQIAMKMTPEDANTDTYIYYKKTKPLLETLAKHGFDAAFGGARRDEEKSRAKERIFSHRNENGGWDPKNQRPELWHLYNSFLKKGESMRIFPLSNWTELDIWNYIKMENIDLVPLYFAEQRQVIKRNGMYLRIDEYVKPYSGEAILNLWCRYRTLGCSPSTGAHESRAETLDEIIEEISHAHNSERFSRGIDHDMDASLEKKKKEGYF